MERDSVVLLGRGVAAVVELEVPEIEIRPGRVLAGRGTGLGGLHERPPGRRRAAVQLEVVRRPRVRREIRALAQEPLDGGARGRVPAELHVGVDDDAHRIGTRRVDRQRAPAEHERAGEVVAGEGERAAPGQGREIARRERQGVPEQRVGARVPGGVAVLAGHLKLRERQVVDGLRRPRLRGCLSPIAGDELWSRERPRRRVGVRDRGGRRMGARTARVAPSQRDRRGDRGKHRKGEKERGDLAVCDEHCRGCREPLGPGVAGPQEWLALTASAPGGCRRSRTGPGPGTGTPCRTTRRFAARRPKPSSGWRGCLWRPPGREARCR